MAMPFFAPGDNPGASFLDLLRRTGVEPFAAGDAGRVSVPHATTCVALRFGSGVVMAGDRRATSGNLISHRSMEKVVEADRLSGVAIAGAAGPAMEMIKLFQLQLEHYEKVEGMMLSLEGKANQLSMLVRGNLPAAMQGMVVVPIFAGYDTAAGTGRLWDYDPTGGRYEEKEYVATGSVGDPTSAKTMRSGWQSRRCGKQPMPIRQPVGPTHCAGSTRSRRRSHRMVGRASTMRASPQSSKSCWSSSARETEGTRDEHALLRRTRADNEGPCGLCP